MKRNPKSLRYKTVKPGTEVRKGFIVPGNSAAIINKTVYVAKGSPKWLAAHEEGHYVLGHNTTGKIPNDVRKFVKNEVDAHVYAYNKLGQPKDIKGRLRGLHSQITGEDYNSGWDNGIKHIDKAINRKSVPQSWKKEWGEVKKESWAKD
jgi:hypothetical protein